MAEWLRHQTRDQWCLESRDRIPPELTVGTLLVNNICAQTSWPTQMDRQSYTKKQDYIHFNQSSKQLKLVQQKHIQYHRCRGTKWLSTQKRNVKLRGNNIAISEGPSLNKVTLYFKRYTYFVTNVKAARISSSSFYFFK